MPRYLAAAIILAGALGARAQTGAIIRGSVTDPQGKIIPGASVSLFARDANRQRGATADESGAYQFRQVAPGAYLIRAEASGFASAARKISVQRGAVITADLALDLASMQQQVVVTASATPQTADEVSKAASSVTAQEIDQRDQYALSEALGPVPGLRIQQQGGPLAFTAIRIRGLPNQDTAVLIDGMRFRDPSSTQADASGFIEDLLATDLDRVEVLRGSGSSLYGTNAIGGVVNIVTDPGGGRTRGSLLVEGGSLGTFRGRAKVDGGWLRDRIQYSAGVAQLNVVNGVDNDDPARDTSEQGRISFRLTPTTQVTVRAYGADSFIKLNSSPLQIGNLPPTGIIDAIPAPLSQLRLYENGVPLSALSFGNATFLPSPDDPDSTRAAHFFTGLLTLEGQPTSALDYAIAYQGMEGHRAYGDGPAGVEFQPAGSVLTLYDGVIQTMNARLDYRLPYNLITGGYEFESENFTNSALSALDPASNSYVNATQRSNTVFLQDQIRLLGDRLQFSAAGRAQYFSLEQPQFQPAASAPYQNTAFAAPPSAYTGDGSAAYFFRRSNTKLRAHAGRGYRAPSLYERFGTGFDSFFGYSVYGDPFLRPERSIGMDAGLDQDWLNGRLHASATYFYTRLQETIIFDTAGGINPVTDPFGRAIGYLNSHGGLARGVEASVRWAARRNFDITSAYTFTNAIEKTPIVAGILQSFAAPRHQLSITATQRIGKRFLASFEFLGSSDYVDEVFGDVNRAYNFNGLRQANLAASYTLPLGEFKAVRFFAKGANLLNQAYYESGFRTPGITGMGGMQFEF